MFAAFVAFMARILTSVKAIGEHSPAEASVSVIVYPATQERWLSFGSMLESLQSGDYLFDSLDGISGLNNTIQPNPDYEHTLALINDQVFADPRVEMAETKRWEQYHRRLANRANLALDKKERRSKMGIEILTADEIAEARFVKARFNGETPQL